MQEKDFLMIPGPTPVPESVLLELAKHPIGHRSKEFSKIFVSANQMLKDLAGTKNDVYIYTASGTGAMEAGIANTINPGDKVLSLVIGVFGQRFADIAKLYGAEQDVIKMQPGECIQKADLEAALASKQYKAVTITHSETSTGTANDLVELAPIIKQHGALLMVDAVTSLGCMPLEMDKLGIDVLVSGSQKGFMIPPGLSFIFVSKEALKAKSECKTPNYYFCWQQARKALENDTTPWTPNVSHIVALEHALQLMKAEGKENIHKRHARLRDSLRAGLKALDLKLLTEDSSASAAITAIHAPEGISIPDLRAGFKNDWHITVANGQKELKDKIFRIGHLGFVTDRDVLMGLSTLEMSLAKLGYDFKMGASLKAYHEFMTSHTKELVQMIK
jgi:aspartate aminotransferase-like enzyme